MWYYVLSSGFWNEWHLFTRNFWTWKYHSLLLHCLLHHCLLKSSISTSYAELFTHAVLTNNTYLGNAFHTIRVPLKISYFLILFDISHYLKCFCFGLEFQTQHLQFVQEEVTTWFLPLWVKCDLKVILNKLWISNKYDHVWHFIQYNSYFSS